MWKHITVCGALFLLLTVCSLVTFAHVITSASVTVSPGCDGYTITVSGNSLSQAGTVDYAIDISDSGFTTTGRTSAGFLPRLCKRLDCTACSFSQSN